MQTIKLGEIAKIDISNVDKKTKETLEKAEKVIKENPKLKNKTVVVPDYDKQEKAYKKLSDEVNKIKVTTKSGKSN